MLIGPLQHAGRHAAQEGIQSPIRNFSREGSELRADHFQADLAKAEATDTIDDGDESLQPRRFIGADQDQRLAGMGEERGIELLLSDSTIVQEQFTRRRDGNDEWSILPIAGRRGFGQIDWNLACRNECGGGQHNDQKHQHDIDQGDHVDLIDLTIHVVPCTAREVRSRAAAVRCS